MSVAETMHICGPLTWCPKLKVRECREMSPLVKADSVLEWRMGGRDRGKERLKGRDAGKVMKR